MPMGSEVRQVWVQGLALPHISWATLRALLLASLFPHPGNVNNTLLSGLFAGLNEILMHVKCSAEGLAYSTYLICV